MHVESAFERRDRIAREPRHIQMHWTRGAGRRFAKSLANEMVHLLQHFDACVELGYRLIERCVLDFLIRVAILKRSHVPPRDRNNRGMSKVRVLHAGSEVSRAHRLSHAHAGTAGYTSVAVRHVRDSLLGVSEHPRDGEVFHLCQRTTQHCVHEEYVRHPIRLQHACEEPRAGHFFSHPISFRACNAHLVMWAACMLDDSRTEE
jgi:hypothetical protein